MSPTLLTPISTESNSTKQLIWCYDNDVNVLNVVLLAYQHVLQKYPAYSTKTELVLLKQPEIQLPERVKIVDHFSEEGKPCVKIALKTSVDTHDTMTPTLVSIVSKPNHIQTNPSDYAAMATHLKNAL
ncbi:hypothetical protein A0J61_10515, partial [Choanephora cucurbitarum]